MTTTAQPLHVPPPSAIVPAPGRASPSQSRHRTLTPSVLLYYIAVPAGLTGVALVLLNGSAAALGSLAGLIAVLVTLAAAIQHGDEQRTEQRLAKEQAERESLREFDKQFTSAVVDSSAQADEARASAAASLLAFLRKDNIGAYSRQTYDFALAFLKIDHPGQSAAVTQSFAQVFQSAARQVLIPGQEHHGQLLAVDLSEALLDRVDLSELEIAEANLTNIRLRRADLTGACLWRAHGEHADLTGSCLRHANLEEVLLPGLTADHADFTYANLVAARFGQRSRSITRGTYLTSLRHARFNGARLQGASFAGADLDEARFAGANLRGANFRGAKLNDAARRSVLDARNRSWRHASWDDDDWAKLNDLQADRDRRHDRAKAIAASADGDPRATSSLLQATPSPRRKPADVAAPDYRRHPHRGLITHYARSTLI